MPLLILTTNVHMPSPSVAEGQGIIGNVADAGRPVAV